MDNILLMVALYPIIFVILFITLLYYVGIYNTRKMFMVDYLERYGGTIIYQGMSFRVQRNAEIKVGMSGITIYNPDGTVRAFRTVNPIFSPAPVVTIGDGDKLKEERDHRD